MIHILQVLCGPARHAIMGLLYNDEEMASADVKAGMELLIERKIASGLIERRCAICDKPIVEFVYEDQRTKEQDWDKAKALSERLEAEQLQTRETVIAARRAAKN